MNATARKTKKAILLIIALATLPAFFMTYKYLFDSVSLPSGVKLICRNSEGPTSHTAVFSLSSPGNTYDKDFITDFCDGELAVPIKPGITHAHYYEIPGRYYAQLNAIEKY